MGITIGRLRKLSDEQVRAVLAWHARYVAWREMGTPLEVAEGVSAGARSVPVNHQLGGANWRSLQDGCSLELF
jgi:hypothetical protein